MTHSNREASPTRILVLVMTVVLIASACGGDESGETTLTTAEVLSSELAPTSTTQATPPTSAAPEEPEAADANAPTRRIQEDLATLGFYGGPIDGLYGPMTEAAIRDFQTSAGIGVDGLYGPQTDAAVQAALAEATPEVPEDPETVNAIMVISGETEITFNSEVSCVLGADDSGLISGVAEDGTIVSVTLDGTASQVVVDGPSLSVNAPVTSVSRDQLGLAIVASPPPLELLIALSFCIAE